SGTTTLGINAASIKSALEITGNAGANTLTATAFADTIAGGAGADTIVGGGGADQVTMEVAAGSLDAADAGGIAEGNQLVLTGAAAGTLVADLASADQIVSIGGAAEVLRQAGFLHVDAAAVTTAVSISGTAAANRITGGTGGDLIDGGAGNDTLAGGDGHDTVIGGTGADTITLGAGAADIDQVAAGADAESNTLILQGTAGGTVVLDLSSATDQIVSVGGVAEGLVQTGLGNVDASAMGGGAVAITGSALANTLRGTGMADTLDGGAGADTLYFVVGTAAYDQLDAGGGNEGDILKLEGTPAGEIVVDLGAAPGTDQLLSENGIAEGVVQADFQHVDASGLAGLAGSDPGLSVFGNGAGNVMTGSLGQDNFVGFAGADTINLGGTYDAVAKLWTGDSAADLVVYTSPDDGWNASAVAYSHDRLLAFETGRDAVAFTTEFNGGAWDLDDITADDVFTFQANDKADFSTAHEALLVAMDAKVKATVLTQPGFASVAAAVNKVGVVAAAGDDGLLVIKAGGSTGIYYYQESDGRANSVSGGELTLLGVADAALSEADFILG
ncbi:MAG: hypothetical protein JNK22_15190, partial [Rhodocyclaceae bacterium]|nr:hypothetical protein [Rhodocyclaceae bacterium]